jgi:hypothetical protein
MKGSSGYTIIEVMIFLVVSTAMLGSATFLITGRQRATSFSTGMRDIESRINDTINDVDTGFFNTNSKINCTVSGAALSISDTAVTLDDIGKNGDCVLLGKVIQFAGTSSRDTISTYLVAGRKTKRNAQNISVIVDNFAESYPTLVDIESTKDNYRLPNGIEIKSLLSTPQSSVIGIYSSQAGSSLAQFELPGTDTTKQTSIKLKSGSQQTRLEAYNLGFGAAFGSVGTEIKNASAARSTELCFKGQYANQFAKIAVGDLAGGQGTRLEFVSSC